MRRWNPGTVAPTPGALVRLGAKLAVTLCSGAFVDDFWRGAIVVIDVVVVRLLVVMVVVVGADVLGELIFGLVGLTVDSNGLSILAKIGFRVVVVVVVVVVDDVVVAVAVVALGFGRA